MKSLQTFIFESFAEQPDSFFITEGLDIEYRNGKRFVVYNPHHQNLINTSEEDNPTTDNNIISGIPVYSVFTQNHIGDTSVTYLDGNPLVYAFKGEYGWQFKTQQDRDAIIQQMKKIIKKFVKDHLYDVTVLIPSQSYLNNYIANIYQQIDPEIEIIDGILEKLTIGEVYEEMINNNDDYIRYIEKHPEIDKLFIHYLKEMDDKNNGIFSFHRVHDDTLRDMINKTMKLSDKSWMNDAGQINDRDILIIDDVVSRGKTIREAIELIRGCFQPNSISVLTMFSVVKN